MVFSKPAGKLKLLEKANAKLKKPLAFKSHHPGGANRVLGDTEVRFVMETIDYPVSKSTELLQMTSCQ